MLGPVMGAFPGTTSDLALSRLYRVEILSLMTEYAWFPILYSWPAQRD